MLLITAGCATSPRATPAPEAEAISLELRRLAAAGPDTFKMLHQVVARFHGQSFPMTGYLLGRRDGSFRVSASVPMGPKLFDIARLSGRWETKVYLGDAAARVDPLEVGRAVERIYFIDAQGAPELSDGAWVTRRPLTDPDADTLEVSHRLDALTVFRKRFFQSGRVVQEIHYDQLEVMHGQSIARRVVLTDARGFSLELAVTGYEPGAPVPDDVLRLPR